MTVRQLIDAIDSGKTLEIESAFETIMADKVATKLDGFRQEVSKSMFASQVAESKDEKEDDDDEDKEDDKEDDDEDDDEDEDKKDKKEMKEGAYTNPGLEALLAKKRAEKAAAKQKQK
jgi:hypothetical protein